MSLKENYENAKKNISEEVQETKGDLSNALASGKKTAGKFFRRLLWALLGLGILAVISFLVYANLTYSNGSRAGQLIKISDKGVVIKTYEGQLSLGGITTDEGGANFGNVWEFSVADEAVYQELQNLRGKQVVVTYEEKYTTLPWRGDTKYIVVEVKEN